VKAVDSVVVELVEEMLLLLRKDNGTRKKVQFSNKRRWTC